MESWKDQLPQGFDGGSKIWIYQCNRAFRQQELREIREQLEQFYQQWTSHGTPVKGWAGVLHGQFIVFVADESSCGVSGCSTDSSVRVVKSLEWQYGVQLFDRLTLTFLVNGRAEMLPLSQVGYALEKGYIDTRTELFDNSVATLDELRTRWIVPMEDTWLGARFANRSEKQS